MILRGILDRSLGGAICIRGYANIVDIAKASEPNKKYQRVIIKDHKKEIKEYLQEREYLFFPEVVLSYTLDDKNDNGKLGSSLTDILVTTSGVKKKIKFSISKKKYSGKDSRADVVISTVSMDIDDSILNNISPFKRIDGNHRLTAAEEIDTYYQNIQVPYCIILLNNDIKDEKFESVIFHTINSKGKHLSSEENLKAILNEDHFSDNELSKTFSWAYVKARQLVNKIDFKYLDGIKNSFVDSNNPKELHKRTVAVNILEFLKDKKLIPRNVSIDKLISKLNIINAIYKNEQSLELSKDEGLLIAFIYYAFKKDKDTNTHLNTFKNWVLNNNIHQIKNIETESIVNIYDKVLEKKLRIFMAMPYFDDTEVDNFNEILQRAINNIKEKNEHLNLSKYPIMREEGASMDIVSNLLNNIANCEIFIADITNNNVNVFYEYGFAQSINKPIILIKDEKDNSKPPFDIEHNLRLSYNGHKGLESLLIERLKQTIKQLDFIVNE